MTAKTVTERKLKYHPNAYRFVFDALRYTQERLERGEVDSPDDDEAHISGPELLFGIKEYAVKEFGLLALTVLRQWGIHKTDDFGNIVFELIERGEMRKTDDDQLSDFYDVYTIDEDMLRDYRIDLTHTFETLDDE